MNSMKEIIAPLKDSLGIHEYGFIKTKDLVFSQGVRELCQMNSCGQYGRTWACPPGVGTFEECKKKITAYENLFVFTTLHPLEDSYDFEGMMAGKERHCEICPKVVSVFQEHFSDLFVLSAEGCARCKTCTYPDAPCRFPDLLYPSIESYCVEVNRLAETAEVHYINGADTVTYFGCILY